MCKRAHRNYVAREWGESIDGLNTTHTGAARDPLMRQDLRNWGNVIYLVDAVKPLMRSRDGSFIWTVGKES